jgi:hypothetical protein
MRDDYTFAWFVKLLTIRFLVIEGFVLSAFISFGGQLTHPTVLLGFLGLLVLLYGLCLTLKKHQRKRFTGPGCVLFLLAFFATGLLLGVCGVAQLAGLSTAWLSEPAASVFSLLVLLAPALYHGHILEEGYYQGYLA